MAVRRFIDRDQRSVSISRVLRIIQNHIPVVTFSDHLSVWTGTKLPPIVIREQAMKLFSRFSTDRVQIDRGIIQGAIDRLHATAKKLSKYCNDSIAHLNRKSTSGPLPTYGDLHLALETAESVLRDYRLLLTAEDYPHGLTPVFQDNWKVIFKHPWIVKLPR